MDQLISTARIGRSLGVHLILATQKPSGVVNDQIWSNSRFKVCLKVQDANDSNEVIKTIPSKMKNQVNNSSSDYRVYYNQYDPIIYTQIVDSHIELTVRYLIHPKKARYINSVISNKVIEAYHDGEIELYQD